MRNPQCVTRKKKIGDGQTAKANAEYLSAKLHEQFQPYICRHCGFYHVGHAVPRIVRENTDR